MSKPAPTDLITLDVEVLYGDAEDRVVRPMTFTALELANIVGTAIEIVDRFNDERPIENSVTAMSETFEFLEHEDNALGEGSSTPSTPGTQGA